MRKPRNLTVAGLAVAAVTLAGTPALAEVSGETAFVFNTLSFLMCGFMVMFMAAGFAMLESGMVRSKNVATICLKNIALYSIAGLMFYLVGYDLMYGIDEGGYIGSFSLFWSPDDAAALAEDAASFDAGYSASSDWFFQMVFVATAASIVSGTVAERIKLWPFLIFVAVLTAVIYPIQGSWEWGAGWLDAEFGFSDFAGSTLVHSTGGWAALVGAVIPGCPQRQVQCRRPRQPDAGFVYAAGHTGHVHPVDGLVRFQWRFSAGAGFRC